MRLKIDGVLLTLRVVKLAVTGTITLASHQEANVDARNKDADDSFKYIYKTGGALRAAEARQITISPIGEVKDRGFVV